MPITPDQVMKIAVTIEFGSSIVEASARMKAIAAAMFFLSTTFFVPYSSTA